MGRLTPHTFKEITKNKDAVETGYFAATGGGGQCSANYAVGSSPNKRSPIPRSPVAPYYKEGVVNKSYFDWDAGVVGSNPSP